MTEDNSTTENLVDMDNLDKFEETLFQKDSTGEPGKVVKEKAEPVKEPSEETGDDSPATEDDTEAPDETGDEDLSEDEGDEEDVSEEPAPKKGKKSAQERINEITARARESERREAEYLRRLQELESRSTTEVKAQPAPVPHREQLPADAPKPDAVDEKGEPLYVLGEFDPNYISDLTKFTIASETAKLRQQDQQNAYAQQIDAAKQNLMTNWAERVQAVEADLPDIRENISTLTEAFANLDPAYGEYLAATIMENNAGPEIMHYLSQNIGEAQQIVASGPRAATIAIGRLEQRLSKDDTNEAKGDEKRVSNASPPPASGSRGRGARTSVRPDTDDLDAFEKILFV